MATCTRGGLQGSRSPPRPHSWNSPSADITGERANPRLTSARAICFPGSTRPSSTSRDLLGPFMDLHLSGGSAGIGYVIDHLLVAGPRRCFVQPITSVSSSRWNSRGIDGPVARCRGPRLRPRPATLPESLSGTALKAALPGAYLHVYNGTIYAAALAGCPRGSPIMARASAGVAGSAPRSRMIRTMRSTSSTLLARRPRE